MRQYVLLNNRTGDLFVGIKVHLIDAPQLGDADKHFSVSDGEITVDGYIQANLVQTDSKKGDYQVCLLSHDGWVLEHPEFNGLITFFNRDIEKPDCMEVLGEL